MPRVNATAPITVLPVIFVPRDVAVPDTELVSALLTQHLDLARAHYQTLLGATFDVAPGEPFLHVGFELYCDGRRVNGPNAALWSRARADSGCRWSRDRYPDIDVRCRYNGEPL